MEFSEVVKKRRSIRKYKDREVEKEKIEKIIDAGRRAPSGYNAQPWEFVVVTNKTKKKRIREIYDKSGEKAGSYKQETTFLENGTLIIVIGDRTKMTHIQSCSAAIENMLLSATDLGLGSLWTMRAITYEEDRKEIKKLFGILENFEIVGIIVIGYGDEIPQEKERRKLEDIVHWERF